MDRNETMDISFPPPAEFPVIALEGAVLVVKAKSRRGFRRAGIAFGQEETLIPLASLDDDRQKAIANEPELVVSLRLVKPADADAGARDMSKLPPVNAGGYVPGTEKRAVAIRDALPKLLPKKDFTKDGKPEVKAVEKLVGFDTTREEIDAAIAGTPPAAS